MDKNMNKLMATKRKAHPYNLILFWQYVKNQSINPPSREYVAGKTKPTVQQNEKCLPSERYIVCAMIMLKDDLLNLSIRHRDNYVRIILPFGK